MFLFRRDVHLWRLRRELKANRKVAKPPLPRRDEVASLREGLQVVFRYK